MLMHVRGNLVVGSFEPTVGGHQPTTKSLLMSNLSLTGIITVYPSIKPYRMDINSYSEGGGGAPAI